jgi:hypothetical protein
MSLTRKMSYRSWLVIRHFSIRTFTCKGGQKSNASGLETHSPTLVTDGHTRDGYGITAGRRDIRYVARLPLESSVDRDLAVFAFCDPWIPIVRSVRGAPLAMVGPSA